MGRLSRHLGISTLAWAPLSAMAGADAGGGAAVVSGGDVLRMVLTLGLVLAAILLLAWLLRRAGGIGGAAPGMRVLGSLSVGQRERVVLVDVGGRQILVGVAPGNVRLLESFSEAVVDSDPGAAVGGDFAARLRTALAGQGGKAR